MSAIRIFEKLKKYNLDIELRFHGQRGKILLENFIRNLFKILWLMVSGITHLGSLSFES